MKIKAFLSRNIVLHMDSGRNHTWVVEAQGIGPIAIPFMGGREGLNIYMKTCMLLYFYSMKQKHVCFRVNFPFSAYFTHNGKWSLMQPLSDEIL